MPGVLLPYLQALQAVAPAASVCTLLLPAKTLLSNPPLIATVNDAVALLQVLHQQRDCGIDWLARHHQHDHPPVTIGSGGSREWTIAAECSAAQLQPLY